MCTQIHQSQPTSDGRALWRSAAAGMGPLILHSTVRIDNGMPFNNAVASEAAAVDLWATERLRRPARLIGCIHLMPSRRRCRARDVRPCAGQRANIAGHRRRIVSRRRKEHGRNLLKFGVSDARWRLEMRFLRHISVSTFHRLPFCSSQRAERRLFFDFPARTKF